VVADQVLRRVQVADRLPPSSDEADAGLRLRLAAPQRGVIDLDRVGEQAERITCTPF